VTVTVAQVLPNGNLVVQGEKWITINHGDEFIRIRGIVRPMDIGPDNSVPSTKVADAQILYSGKGSMARAQRPGWLTEFFLSPLMPF
jgi:flagellar L-ring protein precursor FlgH